MIISFVPNKLSISFVTLINLMVALTTSVFRVWGLNHVAFLILFACAETLLHKAIWAFEREVRTITVVFYSVLNVCIN